MDLSGSPFAMITAEKLSNNGLGRSFICFLWSFIDFCSIFFFIFFFCCSCCKVGWSLCEQKLGFSDGGSWVYSSVLKTSRSSVLSCHGAVLCCPEQSVQSADSRDSTGRLDKDNVPHTKSVRTRRVFRKKDWITKRRKRSETFTSSKKKRRRRGRGHPQSLLLSMKRRWMRTRHLQEAKPRRKERGCLKAKRRSKISLKVKRRSNPESQFADHLAAARLSDRSHDTLSSDSNKSCHVAQKHLWKLVLSVIRKMPKWKRTARTADGFNVSDVRYGAMHTAPESVSRHGSSGSKERRHRNLSALNAKLLSPLMLPLPLLLPFRLILLFLLLTVFLPFLGLLLLTLLMTLILLPPLLLLLLFLPLNMMKVQKREERPKRKRSASLSWKLMMNGSKPDIIDSKAQTALETHCLVVLLLNIHEFPCF